MDNVQGKKEELSRGVALFLRDRDPVGFDRRMVLHSWPSKVVDQDQASGLDNHVITVGGQWRCNTEVGD